MKGHIIPTEEAAVKTALGHLESISFLGRLVADKPSVKFNDGAEITERHSRDFPNAPMEPMNDYWTVSFPLVEPLPEIDVNSRYVIVDAVTGECMLGLP